MSTERDQRRSPLHWMPASIPIGGGRGSRGGAPIWVMHGEGFGLMGAKSRWRGGDSTAWRNGWGNPAAKAALAGGAGRLHAKRQAEGGRMLPHAPRKAFKGSACNVCGSNQHLSSQHEATADPDGFAVFGRYPKGLLRHVLKLRLLGDVERAEVLHVCSGTLGPSEAWTVDVRAEAKPRVIADGKALPFRASSFKAVMLDPPYSDAYARNLYGVENPRPSWLMREAARVVIPGGRIALLHVAIPFSPPGCHLLRVYPVSTGVGFRIRAFTVYEKRQEGLL